MMMRNFITCVFAITVILIFLGHHPVVSLSPIQQKTALLQFQQSLTISEFDVCYYTKTMNWSMNSDYCTWEGVSCERKTRDVIGLDLSCSQLKGAILPNSTLFQLSHLRFLNLFGNEFSLSKQFPQEFGFFAKGHIPSSIGNLSMLESLDLSSNQLEGEIPHQLTSIYSLARLNMSCNQLRGHIPEGSQFNTFENDSYVGNLGLCGNPLSKKCEINTRTQEEDDEDDDYFFSGFTWKAVVIGYGCGVVPAFVAGYLMLLAGKPKWFAGIISRELGLKIRRMEIKWR